jgi:hypothetical protein
MPMLRRSSFAACLMVQAGDDDLKTVSYLP